LLLQTKTVANIFSRYLSTPIDLRSVFHCLDAVDFFDPSMHELEAFAQSRHEFGCPVHSNRSLQNKSIQECVDNACQCLNVFFPGIVDIHFEDFCRGNPTFAEVKANKRDQPTKTTFRNQCTYENTNSPVRKHFVCKNRC
jgi:hypothetical protein